jgi:phosphoribosylamine--glycine ligase
VKVLVVGGGGREHALCWALHRDLSPGDLFCAPGNPGTAELATNLPVGTHDDDRLIAAAQAHAIDLTVIGPEAPLAKGLADRMRAVGLSVFGPSAAAARIESSKAFAKEVMSAAGIPTAASRTFTELNAALAYVDRHAEPLVVKASGLAAGKGALVCADRQEAKRALTAMLRDGIFGDAGKLVIVEDFLEGEELSVLAISNGVELVVLPPAQDHKRLLDRDIGPNTGGMGAYSPVSIATPELLQRVEHQVLRPALEELARRDSPFTGVLYAGLMIDAGGAPQVIEFNCRLGDPETQVILPRITSGLLEAFQASAAARPLPRLEVSGDAAVTTVLAAAGYPGEPKRGDAIKIPDNLPPSALLFHAATQRDEAGVLRTNGGRVLAVTAVAPSFRAAQQTSRAAADAIAFEGKQFRSDIGWREARRLANRQPGTS